MADVRYSNEGIPYAFDENSGQWTPMAEAENNLDAALIGAGRTFDQIGAGSKALYYEATGDDQALSRLRADERESAKVYGQIKETSPVASTVGEFLPGVVAGGGLGLLTRTASLGRMAMAESALGFIEGGSQYNPNGAGAQLGQGALGAVVAGGLTFGGGTLAAKVFRRTQEAGQQAAKQVDAIRAQNTAVNESLGIPPSQAMGPPTPPPPDVPRPDILTENVDMASLPTPADTQLYNAIEAGDLVATPAAQPRNEMIKRAHDYGFKTTWGVESGEEWAKRLEVRMGNQPAMGILLDRGIKDPNQQVLNKSGLKAIGAKSTNIDGTITPDIIAGRYDALGNDFAQMIGEMKRVDTNPTFQTRMKMIAEENLADEFGSRKLAKFAERLSGTDTMSAKQFNVERTRMTNQIVKEAKKLTGKDYVRLEQLHRMVEAMDDAMITGARSADNAALAKRYATKRQQWKFLRAMNDQANVLSPGGNLNNRAWFNQIRKVFPEVKTGHVFANPEQYNAALADAANTANVAASDVMTEIVGNSGTAARLGSGGNIVTDTAIDYAASKAGGALYSPAVGGAVKAATQPSAAATIAQVRGAPLSATEGIISGLLANAGAQQANR